LPGGLSNRPYQGAFCKILSCILIKRSFTWFSCLKNMFTQVFLIFYVGKAEISSSRTHFGHTSPKPRFLT